MIVANIFVLQIRLSSSLSTRPSCTVVRRRLLQGRSMHFIYRRRYSSLLHQHRQMRRAKNPTGQDLRGSEAALHLLISVLYPTSHIHQDQRLGDSQ